MFVLGITPHQFDELPLKEKARVIATFQAKNQIDAYDSYLTKQRSNNNQTPNSVDLAGVNFNGTA